MAYCDAPSIGQQLQSPPLMLMLTIVSYVYTQSLKRLRLAVAHVTQSLLIIELNLCDGSGPSLYGYQSSTVFKFISDNIGRLNIFFDETPQLILCTMLFS